MSILFGSVGYLNSQLLKKSLAKSASVINIPIANPNSLIERRTGTLTGILNNFSIQSRNKCPPSKTGSGSKLSIATIKEIKEKITTASLNEFDAKNPISNTDVIGPCFILGLENAFSSETMTVSKLTN